MYNISAYYLISFHSRVEPLARTLKTKLKQPKALMRRQSYLTAGNSHTRSSQSRDLLMARAISMTMSGHKFRMRTGRNNAKEQKG